MSKTNSNIDYAYCSNYKRKIINEIEYIYIWNNDNLKLPYLPDMGMCDVDDKFTDEQIKIIDKTIIEFPLNSETYFDRSFPDCINVQELKRCFERMNKTKQIQMFRLLRNEYDMPEKYVDIVRKIILKCLWQNYKNDKNEVLGLIC